MRSHAAYRLKLPTNIYLIGLFLLVILQACSFGQTTATVTVNATSSLGVIPAAQYGINTATWDPLMFDTSIPELLGVMGAKALRYPGGSWSDNYHWQTNSGTPGSGVYPNGNDNFSNFITGLAQPTGTSPIITVNYGSNADGTGGGDPSEAAAWVQYANVTNSYGVKYWEIGNEIYGNGYYTPYWNWETDLHFTDQTPENRVGNSSLSPATYGQNVNAYVSAMKAVDPSIKVGAVMELADGSLSSTDWNSNVLSQCGNSVDFVVMHWYPEFNTDSDSGLLANPANIASYMANMRAQINEYCGAHSSNVQIFITETNADAGNPGKQLVSLVNALFAADNVTTWLENGAANVDWWDLHNGPSTTGDNDGSLFGNTGWGDEGVLSTGNWPEPQADLPFAPYYGLEMVGELGSPGDTMVSSTSTNGLLKVHSVKQANGHLGVMLINEDPTNTVTVNVGLTGFSAPGPTVLYGYSEDPTYYGGGNWNVWTALPQVTGSSFTVTIPPYSIYSYILGSTIPQFDATSTVPSEVQAGHPMTFAAYLRNFGGAPLDNGRTTFIVHDAAGNAVEIGRAHV